MNQSQIDPCILHRSVPMSRMDLLPSTPINRSGLYLKPPKKVRIPTRPQQVGLMLQDVKHRTGTDLTPLYIKQYEAPLPVKKDLVDFTPYYDEAPIIGSGGLITRPTLAEQTYINIVSQLNLTPPIVSGGSTLTLVPTIIPAAVTEIPSPYAGTGMSGLQTPSPSGGNTPPLTAEDIDESRNLMLERDRQVGLGNIEPGYGQFPPVRKPSGKPMLPKPSQSSGSNIVTLDEREKTNIMETLKKPFSRFGRVPPRAKIEPTTSIPQAVLVESIEYDKTRV